MNRFLRWLRGGYYLARYPRHADFVEMGFGIERRAERYAAAWKHHLELSKECIRASLDNASEYSLAVLGAGRLFDFPLEVKGRAGHIALVDADPSCQSSWRSLIKAPGEARITSHLLDITGVVEAWDVALSAARDTSRAGDWSVMENFLAELTVPQLRLREILGFTPTCILSLSLLSQIPIYWRERVETRLSAWGELPEKVVARLHESEVKLQESHLKLLHRSGAERIIIIADSDFYQYSLNESHWLDSPAHPFHLPDCFPGYELSQHDSWFWHIVPALAAGEQKGAIHRVEALCFNLSSGNVMQSAPSF